MKHLSSLTTAIVFLACLAPTASSADAQSQNTTKAIDTLEFSRIGDLPIEIAVLWGDPQKGASAIMLKFPPNFPGGMHKHTNSYHGVVIKGGSKHWVKGETEESAPLQRPGDYWYQVGGQVHQDSFPTDEETILYLQFDGPLDTIFAD